MALPDSETSITNSFRELLNYITSLGEHVNQIYDRLEKIEADLNKAMEELGTTTTDNRKELEDLKKNMITKAEFNNLLKKLNEPFEKFTPPKTRERTRRTRTTTQTEQEKTSSKT